MSQAADILREYRDEIMALREKIRILEDENIRLRTLVREGNR